jgi:hypothetical protein
MKKVDAQGLVSEKAFKPDLGSSRGKYPQKTK